MRRVRLQLWMPLLVAVLTTASVAEPPAAPSPAQSLIIQVRLPGPPPRGVGIIALHEQWMAQVSRALDVRFLPYDTGMTRPLHEVIVARMVTEDRTEAEVLESVLGTRQRPAPAFAPERYGLSRAFVVQVPPDVDVRALVNRARGTPALADFEFHVNEFGVGFSADPLFADQWGLENTGQPIGGGQVTGTPDADVDGPEAWMITEGCRDVVIAVIDTGVAVHHPDLKHAVWVNQDELRIDNGDFPAGLDANRDGMVRIQELLDFLGVTDPRDVVAPGSPFLNGLDDNDPPNLRADDLIGYDFVLIGDPAGCDGDDTCCDEASGEDCETRDPDPSDVDGHGTGVAGVVAMEKGNMAGGAGLSPGCSIMPVRAGYATTGAPVFAMTDVVNAITYAWLSGADVVNMSFGFATPGPLEPVLQAAHDAGVVLVAAAGNDNDTTAPYPAAFDAVIAVAGVDSQFRKEPSSNHGSWVDLSAPGWQVLTTTPDGSWALRDGTSFAAPWVAAAAALAKCADPELTSPEVATALITTASSVSPLEPLPIGAGVVNALSALEPLVAGGCAGDVIADDEIDVSDLVAVIKAWGPCVSEYCPADVNGDGIVSVDDLVIVISGWGLCPSDVSVDSVAFSAEPVLSEEMVTVTIELGNGGPEVDATVSVAFDGDPPVAEMDVLVETGGTTVIMDVATPTMRGCSGPQPVDVIVSVDTGLGGSLDPPANNDLATALEIEPLFVDLVVDVSAPSCALVFCQGPPNAITYDVDVTNMGNDYFPGRTDGLRTGICLTNGSGCWTNNCICSPNGGTLEKDIPSLAPGQTKTIEVPYTICCRANFGWQSVKAGLSDACGGSDVDDCSGGNFAYDCICIGCSCGGSCPF